METFSHRRLTVFRKMNAKDVTGRMRRWCRMVDFRSMSLLRSYTTTSIKYAVMVQRPLIVAPGISIHPRPGSDDGASQWALRSVAEGDAPLRVSRHCFGDSHLSLPHGLSADSSTRTILIAPGATRKVIFKAEGKSVARNASDRGHRGREGATVSNRVHPDRVSPHQSAADLSAVYTHGQRYKCHTAGEAKRCVCAWCRR